MLNQTKNSAAGMKVPFGFYPVKDSSGRETGEVLPVPNVNDRANSRPALQPVSAAQIARNTEVRLLIEPMLRGDASDDKPIIMSKVSAPLSKQDVLNLMVPAKVEDALAAEVGLPSSSQLQPDPSLAA